MAMSNQSSKQLVRHEDIEAFLVKAGLIETAHVCCSGPNSPEDYPVGNPPGSCEDFARVFSHKLMTEVPDAQWKKLRDGVDAWCKKASVRDIAIDPKGMLEASILMRAGLSHRYSSVDESMVDLFLMEFRGLVKQHLGKGDRVVDRAFETAKQVLTQRNATLATSPPRSTSSQTGATPSAPKNEITKEVAVAGRAPDRGQASPTGGQPAEKDMAEPKPAAAPGIKQGTARQEAPAKEKQSPNAELPSSAEPVSVPKIPDKVDHDEKLQPSPSPHSPVSPGAVPTAPPPSVPTPLWNHLPVPDDPDKHDEYDVRSMVSPEGMPILGARVRGKKHKHDGTNCDDWFEFAVAGKWSIFAVADGGGSYKFSRVGARAACESSKNYLIEALSGLEVKPRKDVTEDILCDSDIKAAKAAIHEGMRRAWQGIQEALRERDNRLDHYLTLQSRRLTLRDLQSTLLLAIHTTLETSEGPRSLVFACAAGDGFTSLINKKGECNILMRPDSGEYVNEVEFLDARKLTDASLAAHTFPFAGGMKALMLMTDGVANDYFPSDPGMAELYADLVLNEILPAEECDKEAMIADLQGTRVQNLDALRNADFLIECERIAVKKEKITLACAKKYAEMLGVEPHDLARRPGLLAAARLCPKRAMANIEGREEIPGRTPQEKRLLLWLDSYYVKGSFDDRTLIVMTGSKGK